MSPTTTDASLGSPDSTGAGADSGATPESAPPAATSSPAATPATPRPVSTSAPLPSAEEPLAPTSVVAVATTSAPTPPAPQSFDTNFIMLAAGAAAALAVGYGVWQLLQGNAKQEKQSDRCAPLKIKLEQKKSELAAADGQFSLQQTLVDTLKEKLQDKVQDTALDVAANALGETAQKMKEAYDALQEKYEQATKALDALQKLKAQLAGEVKTLESAYATCVGTDAAATLGGVSSTVLPELRSRLVLYNVVSADGYLATKEGDEDFIPDELWPKTLEVFKQYDTLVMGRKTYEALQGYASSLLMPFEALPIKKIVITKEKEFVPKTGYKVVHSLSEIAALPGKVLVCSGPELNNALYKEGMVAKHIFETVPATLGDGIKPFDFEHQ